MKMKALYRPKYINCSKITVEEIDIPTIKSLEVLVKVHATTVNRTDIAHVGGLPLIMRAFIGFFTPKIKVLGTDFAGEVVDTGADVTDYKIGDRLMGFRDEGLGSQAEYLAINVDRAILHIPKCLDYIEAAACQEATHYAYSWIKDKEINSNHRILINGVTGAIGSALIQYINNFDAEITAVGNTKNFDLIKKLGAKKIYDYEKEDFLTCDLKYDYIFDAVGKSTFGKCKHLLKPQGIYLSSELGPWLQNPFLALLTSKSKSKRVEFPLPSDILSSMKYVKDLVLNGKYKPVIEKAYPIEKASEAYTYVKSGKKTGNVILTID